jgi:spore maturation protein CgeB
LNKKILLIGSSHPAALELILSKELTGLGINNHVLGIQNIFLQYYNKSFFNKIVFRLGLSCIEKHLQEIIKQKVIQYNPEIILVFKGMEITPKTLGWIKSRGIMVANYNPDSPFIFSGRGSGNKNVSRSITLFDIYFTYDKSIKAELEMIGVRTSLIPFGFDESAFDFKELKEENEILKLCFLGNADKHRISFLNELAERGIEIEVYGENWALKKLNSNIKVHGPLYGEPFWETLQKYAVQLNLLRPHNLASHNMRSFDIPGAGGIMLAPRTPDHETYFGENDQVFLFNDCAQAAQKTKEILMLTFNERNAIRNAARIHAAAQHTYLIRTKALIAALES